MNNVLRKLDSEALDLTRQLITEAKFGALGTVEPETESAMVTRIAFSVTQDGELISLVSMLSHHTQALLKNPACSILLGEPEDKGDPLTHPRITIQATAGIIEHGTEDYQRLAQSYLEANPKAKLYIGFTDFRFLVFKPSKAYLNGGFGKAFILNAENITSALSSPGLTG